MTQCLVALRRRSWRILCPTCRDSKPAVHAVPAAQAEMINLKAQFLAVLGDDDASHATFSEALMLYTLCCEAWVSPAACPPYILLAGPLSNVTAFY